MPKIDLTTIPERKGSSYPAPFDKPAAQRSRQRVGDAGGLTQFGVNLLRLPPGAWSSQRHWHSGEDEFVYVISGEVTLITNRGEEILRAGDCVAFPCSARDGHHLINRSDALVMCLEVGTRGRDDFVDYPDIDMVFDHKVGWYTRRDGTPYPKKD